MGHSQASGMAEAVSEGDISLEGAIEYHLTANHYPPVPRIMVGVCIDAIDAYAEGYPDSEILLPRGVTYRDGRRSVTAYEVAESFHLDAFLPDPDDGHLGEVWG